jgi:hypothetical protein
VSIDHGLFDYRPPAGLYIRSTRRGPIARRLVTSPRRLDAHMPPSYTAGQEGSLMEKCLNVLLQALVPYRPQRIILFGSVARGGGRRQSFYHPSAPRGQGRL